VSQLQEPLLFAWRNHRDLTLSASANTRICWMQLGRALLRAATLAFVIGSSYPLWSALYHPATQKPRGE
jgi:hypothetical protein